jgi:hypothetical protein
MTPTFVMVRCVEAAGALTTVVVVAVVMPVVCEPDVDAPDRTSTKLACTNVVERAEPVMTSTA